MTSPYSPFHSSIGGLLDAQPELCYVCEDTNERVVGYVAACSNIQDYQQHLVNTWLPQMKAKYPKHKAEEDAEELLTPQEVREGAVSF